MKYKIVVDNYTIRWAKYKKTHRLYGPAREYNDGSKEWLKNGNWHRLDGPFYEFHDGRKKWFINDKRYTEEEFKRIQTGEI